MEVRAEKAKGDGRFGLGVGWAIAFEKAGQTRMGGGIGGVMRASVMWG